MSHSKSKGNKEIKKLKKSLSRKNSQHSQKDSRPGEAVISVFKR
jgi:hypothetical protein